MRGTITVRPRAAIAAATAFASACTTTSGAMLDLADKPAVSETVTETQSSLRSLPPPRERAAVAVYDFQDQTGQFKPSSAGVQTLSKAVTQGSTSVLLKALQDAGNRSWFTVIERENLDNLLKERQIIREMRRQYLGEEDVNEAALPPLLFAGIILEGGIIGYDTNTITGGAGARFLGIDSGLFQPVLTRSLTGSKDMMPTAESATMITNDVSATTHGRFTMKREKHPTVTISSPAASTTARRDDCCLRSSRFGAASVDMVSIIGGELPERRVAQAPHRATIPQQAGT